MLSGCAYHNPLDSADFRFNTLNTPPYVLASWYRIDGRGEPLYVYVEQSKMTDQMRSLAVRDEHTNVAYLSRPCQFFETSACQENISDSVQMESIQNGIKQLARKAGTEEIIVKGF